MRYAIFSIKVVLITGIIAIGAEFTDARIYQGAQISAERVSMSRGEDPFQYCSRVGNDDDPGEIPASLVPAFARVFGVSMTPIEIQQQSSFRCYRGRVLGCMIGANLNCGRADSARKNPGGDEWCRAHPDAAMIPMAATGHATIYSWRCTGKGAVPGKVISKVDDRGFEVLNWKSLN